MIKLLILSDDFTGALDTSVHFAQNGANTKVVFERNYIFDQDDDTEVIVVDAETRHLEPGEAYSVVYNIVKRGMKAGIKFFYLKTDSALRGNIGSCLEALVCASGAKLLHFIPAYPKMNRLTIKGIQYIDNMKVGDSVFGKDPFNPVKLSSVKQIIGQQTDINCLEIHARNGTSEWDGGAPSIVIYDSVTDLDIQYWAERLYREGKLKVMAGCAGFASALPDIMRLKHPVKRRVELKPGIFAASGSINPITLNQISYAVEHGFCYVSVLEIVKKMLMSDTYIFADSAECKKMKEICRNNQYLIIDSSGLPGKQSVEMLLVETRLSMEKLRDRIPGTLGSILKELLGQNEDVTLMITGGDTLLGFLRALDVHYMIPIEEIMPGIVISSFHYRHRQYEIITKSGGFGEKDMFLRLIKYLKEREVLRWENIV